LRVRQTVVDNNNVLTEGDGNDIFTCEYFAQRHTVDVFQIPIDTFWLTSNAEFTNTTIYILFSDYHLIIFSLLLNYTIWFVKRV
jgi:hypothetical protein